MNVLLTRQNPKRFLEETLNYTLPNLSYIQAKLAKFVWVESPTKCFNNLSGEGIRDAILIPILGESCLTTNILQAHKRANMHGI